jgi:hypothetical protein
VDPLKPIEPFHQDNGLFIGLGVAAAVILLLVCGIAVIIQNQTNTTGKLILTI